jgi:FkbM family methyltransferase
MLGSLLKDIYHRGSAHRDVAERVPLRSADAQLWLDELIRRMFQLMHRFEQDNFDAERYRNESANAFFADRHAAYFSFLVRNAADFFRARHLLGDEVSRELYDQLILFRTMGHLHVRLPYSTSELQEHRETADGWRIAETADSGLLGPLAIFSVPWRGAEIRVKCWRENVTAMFLMRQYFLHRDGIAVEPTPGDHVIDAGGCFGDTALAFAHAVGDTGHVYTFDPLPKHCQIMHESFAANPTLASRISVFEVGLSEGDRAGTGPALPAETINPGATAFDEAIPTRAIDSLVTEGAFPRVDFIKMDVEGSELAALKGGVAALRKWKPKLAISLYHRPEDFFAIPLWLDSLHCGYRFFLGHYSIHSEETVLYASAAG